MASYDSSRSGYLHPQYQPQQPPYPTTPGDAPPQQSPFYPAQPPQQQQQQQQPTSHPVSRGRRSSSFASQRPNFPQTNTMPMPIPIRQPHASDYQNQSPSYPRSSNEYPPASSSYPSSSYPSQPPHIFAQPAPTSRSSSHHSHHSHHMHDPHAFADGEDSFENAYRRDEETRRSYERRYAKERAMERRPTMGESVLSMVSKVGSLLGSDRR